jgi:hypothetical protein
METQNNTILVFSVFSGTYYEIPESDASLLDVGHLPLTKKPKSNCSKCFGRGHLGRDTQSYGYAVCSCLQKNINHDIINNGETLSVH